jgi:tetratricopeptide (TPR) repeat protein
MNYSHDESLLFDKAISNNNSGAHYMERGDYGSALKSLMIAFHTFRRTYNKNRKWIDAQIAPTTLNVDELMRKMPFCSHNEDVVVYNQPFYIPAVLGSTAESCGLYSSIINFNLALAHHLLAMETKNQSMLNTAARLYQFGISLERIRSKYSVSPLFLVATLNNLGQIYRTDEDEQEKSKKCFQQILSMLMHLVQVQAAKPSDLEMFFGNTSFGLPQTSFRCAGAA